jgi:hypothetical protein
MSTPFSDDRTQAWPAASAASAPTETFEPMPPGYAEGPGYAQEPSRPEYVRLSQGNAGHPADARQGGTGFTAGERAARSGGGSGHGPVGNWIRTGDSKLNVDSEQGQALAPAIADGWSIAGLITAFFVPLAGLVLSLVAFADAKKNQRRVHGTAVGGFFVSIAGCIIWTVYWVIVIVAMAALTNAVNSNPYGG